jgi:hypothetical protein
MAIVKRPQPNNQNSKSVEDFIGGAPDSGKPAAVEAPAPKARVMKGHQAQITLALPVDLLERANAMADKLSISRAAFMKQAISRAVEAEGV